MSMMNFDASGMARAAPAASAAAVRAKPQLSPLAQLVAAQHIHVQIAARFIRKALQKLPDKSNAKAPQFHIRNLLPSFQNLSLTLWSLSFRPFLLCFFLRHATTACTTCAATEGNGIW